MNTYVFQGILRDYTSGVAVARSTSKELAIKQILKERDFLLETEMNAQVKNNNIPYSEAYSSSRLKLQELEKDLEDCKVFEIPHDVPFAFINGGGS